MKTKKPIETVETVKLDAVTGGCAACGNPNHVQRNQPPPPQWAR